MTDTIFLGAYRGDEGKAKAVDDRAESADMVVKFQGGANSGHTVNGEWEYQPRVFTPLDFTCHAMPDGVLRPRVTNIVSQGVAFDAEQFLLEAEQLTKMGIPLQGRVFVSNRAGVVLTRDIVEDFLSDGNGSTQRGIRFFYERAARPRHRVLMEDVYEGINEDGEVFGPQLDNYALTAIAEYAEKLGPRLEAEIISLPLRINRLKSEGNDQGAEKLERRLIRGMELRERLKPENEIRRILEQADRLIPFVRNTGRLIRDAVKSDRTIVYAGSQSIHLAKDAGAGSDLTASSSSGMAFYSDIGYTYTRREAERLMRIGVLKHLPTVVGRAGHGFPTKDEEMLGHLRVKGREFGATTGRLREMGHPDAVAAAYAAEVAGLDGFFYTKADLVDGEKFPAKIAIAYRSRDGIRFEMVPTKRSIFDGDNLTPIYEEMPGWDGVGGKRSYNELPAEFKNFLERFERIVELKVGREVPIVGISTSPRRGDVIFRWERIGIAA